ncbi:MAG TPA: dTMP kinase [Acidimicrobiales bacterium]|nr:dTMP kinase [Acidimicrobiales bacterium]
MSERGVFLVFEGIDVSGKSTQARRVAEMHDARFTFEPGDTPLGVGLRHLVLDAATPMEPVTEALIMLTDRSHHVATVIEPALRAGRSVVSDRFFASTLAYQGYGRGVDLDLLRRASQLAIGSCVPDATILLDLPVELVNERRTRDQKDRFESADLAFHERVREGYLELAEHEGWIVVDAAPTVEVVATVIDQHVAHLLW